MRPNATHKACADNQLYDYGRQLHDVDVSPDGETLAFDLLGDLYTIPTTGGTAKQLTRGMALHARPVWSPDGKKLAYVSDESGSPNLNVLDIKKGIHATIGNVPTDNEYSSDAEGAIYGFDPIWEPGGNNIFFNNHLYAMDGKEVLPPFTVSNPLRFSSDGKTAYVLDSEKVYRYDLEEKIAKPVSVKLSAHFNGTISPDGRWWCYVTDIKDSGGGHYDSKRQLVALNLNSNVSHVLVSSLILLDPRYKLDPLPFHMGHMPPHFSFSPDSKAVYIGYGGKIHKIEVENGADHIIPFQAHVNVDLGAYNYHTFPVNLNPFHVKYTRSAIESPDRKHLVFTALSKIYMMDLPNGKPHVLCPQPFGQFQPAWSPDGKWIAYTSWCDTVGGFLWRVPASGGNPEQLTTVPGKYNRPAWSPDGKSIAVLQGADKLTGRVFRPDNDFGKLELVTPGEASIRVVADSVPPLFNNPTFSSNGTKLFYTPQYYLVGGKENYDELVSKDLKNGHITTISQGINDQSFNLQQSLSPDGRYIIYSADEDIYLVPLSKFKEPVVLSKWHKWMAGVHFASGVDPHWENGGKTLAWTYGNKFYRIDPVKIIAAAQKKTAARNLKNNVTGVPVTVHINPDKAITLKVTTPGSYAKGIIALRNVRILTMQGNKVIGRGTILIKDGRIAAIGTVAAVPIPKEAKVIDLQGKNIMPGLIDLHLHMAPPPEIFPQQFWQFFTALAYGVTTARDPSENFDSFGYAELLRSGQMTGPRFYTVGRRVNLEDGVLRFDSQADADSIVHRHFMLGGSEIKQYMLPTRRQREWLLLACQKYRVNMTNEGFYAPILQLGQVKDGSTGIEHNPVWGDAYNDVITLRAKAHTYQTATLQVAYGAGGAMYYLDHLYWRYPDAKWQHFIGGGKMENGRLVMSTRVYDTINPGFLAPARVDARIRHAGGSVVMGSHGNDQGTGPHSELWALQMGGLTNMEALQAATINGAKALGIQKDIGSLEVGKIADLLILDKNPLDDIHNSRDIRYVMKGGILYDANTLDELWPVKKKCPEMEAEATDKK